MRFMALRLLLTACVCRLGLCQSTKEIMSMTVETVIRKIEDLSQRVEEMQSGLELMQGSQTDLHRKVEDIMTKLETLDERDLPRVLLNTCTKEQIAILHGSFSTEMERVELAIQGCSSSEQISNLQVLLSTDECAEGSYDCSPNAVCEDALVNYKCKCLEGYSGDGRTCEDMNECITGDNLCHKDGHCTNTVGSYTCSCHTGYTGDGFSCEDIDECRTGSNGCHKYSYCTNRNGNYSCECYQGYSGDGFDCKAGPCELPSKIVTGLGCVTPVRERMTRYVAKHNCLKQGSQLLEGMTSFTQLQEIKEKFFDDTFQGNVLIGMFRWKWMESGDPIPSSLWGRDQPDRGAQECGYIRLSDHDSLYLGDDLCDPVQYSLCQKQPFKNY